ncbi:MAG TPA: PEP-CTERM sorting domain-containing protein [Bryobacteraceae bacterium]|nr:PEP-CTERM sorting domain-containing protein [Bryobacteraceae bacterium]
MKLIDIESVGGEVYHQNMLKALAVVALTMAASMAAKASVIYSFTYTGLSGTFQPFTVVIPETNFLPSSGTTVPITGATLTDGTHSWNFTQLLIESNGANGFCFLLGTAGVTANGCGGFTGATSPGQGEIISAFFNPGGVPTHNSNFTQPGQQFFGETSGGTFASTSGTALLTAVPEPASFLMMGSLLTICGLAFRRRGNKSKK